MLSVPTVGEAGCLGIHLFRADPPGGGNIGWTRHCAYTHPIPHTPDWYVIMDDDSRVKPWTITKAIALGLYKDEIGGISRAHPVASFGQPEAFRARNTDGSISVIRGDAMRQIGGWDPDCGMREDTELAIRLAIYGWEVWVHQGLGVVAPRGVPGGLQSEGRTGDITTGHAYLLKKYPWLLK